MMWFKYDTTQLSVMYNQLLLEKAQRDKYTALPYTLNQYSQLVEHIISPMKDNKVREVRRNIGKTLKFQTSNTIIKKK